MDFVIKYKKLLGASFWLWLAIVLFISLVPQSHKIINTEANSFFRLDYSIHFFIYFSLSVLFALWRIKASKTEIFWFITLGIAVCSFTEILQIYIPGRTFNKFDLLFNIIGITTGIVLTRIIIQKKHPKL